MVGCTEVPKPPPVLPPPHKHVARGRDGRGPWSNHHDALAWLAEAKTHGKESLTFGIPLPDAGNWSYVDFIGLRTVEAWRYENHDARYHAAVAAVAYPSKSPSLEECTQRFAKTARETAKRWDFVLGETRLEEVPFMDATHPSAQPGGTAPVAHARIYALDVVGRSLFGNKHWAAAFGVYPAWKDACMVVAVFVPVRGEFELAFQPQVSLASLEANVVEALLRWRMPDGTYAAPQDFMRVAEECGLIKDIGEWVLRSAVEQTAQWHRAGWREVRVAVNVSSLQLLDGHFAERLQELLRRHELPAHCIEIELTENVLQTGAHTIEALQQLHAAGIGIALDDFGAGYSSLVSLERLPLCRVKLDRNLIAGIDTSARCQAIAQATIALCQNLGLAVTAEGVERREQFAWLTAHPAIQLQGYLLSSPVPREDVLRVVAGMPDHMRTLLRPLPLAPTVRFSDYLESRKRHDR